MGRFKTGRSDSKLTLTISNDAYSKSIQLRKRGVKLSHCMDDLILYMAKLDDPKSFLQRLKE
jgi:hypothetical protein